MEQVNQRSLRLAKVILMFGNSNKWSHAGCFKLPAQPNNRVDDRDYCIVRFATPIEPGSLGKALNAFVVCARKYLNH